MVKCKYLKKIALAHLNSNTCKQNIYLDVKLFEVSFITYKQSSIQRQHYIFFPFQVDYFNTRILDIFVNRSEPQSLECERGDLSRWRYYLDAVIPGGIFLKFLLIECCPLRSHPYTRGRYDSNQGVFRNKDPCNRRLFVNVPILHVFFFLFCKQEGIPVG